MQRRGVLLLVAGLLLVARLASGGDQPRLLLTGQSGLFLLDASGRLLQHRNETFQWWQGHHVAANPRNGTVCWVSAPEDQDLTAHVRCALADDLTTAWDLPTPRNFRVNQADALEVDPDTGNFYITVSRANYVCSYDFQTCARLAESDGQTRFYAAYDVPNRLAFLIYTHGFGPYLMDVMNMDGSGRRQIADNSSLDYPYGMAADSESKMVYWLDRYDGSVAETGIYRFNYDGKGMEMVVKLDEHWVDLSHVKRLQIVGDDIFVLWGAQKRVSRVDKKTGEQTHLVDGKVSDGTTEIAFVKKDLLSLNVISEQLQPPVENTCLRSRGGCGDICVPTLIDGRPSHTCICPAGQELVDTACFDREPATVLVVQRTALQAVDAASGEAAVILAGLSDATKADFFYEGKMQYLLFWLDDGGLFRGRWKHGGQVTDVVTLVPANGTRRVVEVAVDWNQRNVLWIEHNTEAGKYDDNGAIFKIANVHSVSSKTLAEDRWMEQSALLMLNEGMIASYQQDSWGTLELASKNLEGNFDLISLTNVEIPFRVREIRADLSAISDPTDERYFYIDPANGSLLVSTNDLTYSVNRTYTLLRHPSLRTAGGLDVLGERVFWTDAARGVLLSADSDSGAGVTSVGPARLGADLRAVRVLHPLRQPATRLEVCDRHNSGCSHMCVLVLRDWDRHGVCLCPDGTALADDAKTCR